MEALRILVVEDSVDTATTFAEILKLMGHECRCITDSTLAADAAREFKPDVAFLDIGMPVIDGYQLASLLREQHGAGLWICAISGYGSPQDRVRARQAGFDAHLPKPADLDMVEAILDQRQFARRNG